MLKFLMAAGLTIALAGHAVAAEWQKIIAPGDLAALSGDVTMLDIREPKAYAKGHIEGALNAPYGMWRGPKENPGRALSDEALTARMQYLGLTRDTPVVVTYAGANATDFGAAARVYWTLKSAGLTRIAILNGGLAAWAKEGLALTAQGTEPQPSSETFTLSRDWMIDRDGVKAVVTGARDAIMVDARPAAFWQGKTKHKAAAEAGTLKGSLNITHDSWFSGKRTEIVTGERVLEIAKQAGYAPGGAELVSFCNTGHWAATNWFALSELAGIEGVKLYPESMVGWTRMGGDVVNGQ